MVLARMQPAPMMPRMPMSLEDTFPLWDREGVAGGPWFPKVDMYQKGDDVVVEAEIPGFKKEDIDVRVEDHRLTLRGEAHEEKKKTEENYFRHERRSGSFVRSFMLPHDVSAAKVDAMFKDGVLRLTFPKTEEAKGRKIDVK